MDAMVVSLYTLLILLISSNALWAWHCHILINKLMSRNYIDYQEGSLSKSKFEAKLKEQAEQEFFDDNEFASLTELTGNH